MIEHKLYNPASQTKELLIENFVVRTKVFEKIFEDIKTSPMKYPEQNYIIQGQRGSGKTTLLLRLKYEIENNHELNQWLIPIYFSEETYDITTLSNLWEKIIKYLDDIWGTQGIHYEKTSEFIDSDEYEKKCFDYLIEILNKNKKKIILFFDNFGQLFLDDLKPKEQHRLREILMNCSDIRIIGASAIVMNDLYDYSKPFYDFFRVINLESLDKNEIIELIEKLSKQSGRVIDLKKNKAKIETLRILTGGVTRTIILVYEVILADEDGSALKDLETILDRITPLYKHRVEDLPTQQRKIVDIIAKKWDAVSAKEIAEEIREDGKKIPTKIISAQLNQLEKNNVIEKKQTNTKNHFYQLKERFFNIWYLMRLGDRKDKCKVIWLTKFLEVWYEDSDGMKEYLEKHIKHLRSGKYDPKSALTITEALANSSIIEIDSLKLLIDETSSILNSDQKKLLPNIYETVSSYCFDLIRKGEHRSVIKKLESFSRDEYPIYFFLPYCYILSGEKEKAKKLIEEISIDTDFDNILKGFLYTSLGEIENANKFYENAIDSCPESAYKYLAKNYEKIDMFEESIKNYRMAVKYDKELYVELVETLISKGDFEEAISCSREGIEAGVEELKKYLAQLLILVDRDKYKSEIDEIIENGINNEHSNSDFIYLKGAKLYFKADSTKAENYFLKAFNFYKKSKNTSMFTYLNAQLLLNILIENRDKQKSLEILENYNSNDSFPFILTTIFVLIWDNKYLESEELLVKYLNNSPGFETKSNFEKIENIFVLLLSKGQFYTLIKYFEDEKLLLKDRFKPIYYALMTYLKDEYPNEILRMGSELEEPVKEVMAKVEQWAIDYK